MSMLVSFRGCRVESRAGGPRGGPRGFSLVEVLIAILILALGLLGLGAIIPVIVTQQRNATDRTLGIVAAKQAESYLKSRADFDPSVPTPPTVASGPAIAARPNAWYNVFTDATILSTSPSYWLWQTWSIDPVTTPVPSINPDTGEMTFTSAQAADVVRLNLEDRLWPNTSTQPMDTLPAGLDPYKPMFVWDIIARRVQVDPRAITNDPNATHKPEQLQIAIFVRRIDPNIRVPRGYTLLDVLVPGHHTPATPSGLVCMPVGVADTTDPTPTYTGLTTGGSRYYAGVQSLDATFDIGYRDRIVLSNASNAALYDIASRPGQILLDNLGNVYSVREAYDDGSGRDIVLIDPPIPPQVADPGPNPTNFQVDRRLRQVIFTPQIPGTVRLFTITRPAP